MGTLSMSSLFLMINNLPTSREWSMLRETLRYCLPDSIRLATKERVIVERCFANVHNIGDDALLKVKIIDLYQKDVKAVLDHAVKDDDVVKKIMNGNSRELFRLARSVVMKRLPANLAYPEWFNAKDPVEIEGRTTVHYRIVSEIDELSKLTRHLPLTMNLPEDEMRFLSALFSSLTVMKTPKAMRDAVVKNSDFKAISTRHVARDAEASEYAFHEHDVGRARNGHCLELLKLAHAVSFKLCYKKMKAQKKTC